MLAIAHLSNYQGSVLDNDYDPDGDPIEVVAANGATNAGGTYTITAAGIVHYMPPTNSYNGDDYFDYQIREIGGAQLVTARVTIKVGTAAVGVFVRLVLRNTYNNASGVYANYGGEVWLDFFGDPSGNTPIDVSSLGLTINVRKAFYDYWVGGNVQEYDEMLTVNPSGTKMMIYAGDLQNAIYDQGSGEEEMHSITFYLEPGAGYTPI